MAKNFSDEPQALRTYKIALLVFGAIGFIIFTAEYLTAWFYPAVGLSFGRYVMFHVMHMNLLLATCMVRGGIIKPPWFGVYVGAYVICLILDLAGCITRTVIFVYSNLSTIDYVIGLVYIVLEWGLPIVCVVQIVICVFIARSIKTYLYAQDYVVSRMAEGNSEISDKSVSKHVEFLQKQLDIEVKESPASGPRRRKNKSRRGKKQSDTEQPQQQTEIGGSVVVDTAEISRSSESDSDFDFTSLEPVGTGEIVSAN